MQIQRILLIALSFIASNAFAMSPGIKDHTRGDVIAVKTDDQIAAWCDFSKQIVNTQFNTLCVYNGNSQSLASNEFRKQG